MWIYSNKQKGLSLIELIISLSLSLFVVLGIISFMAHFEKRKNMIIHKIELEQNIQAITHVISGQLRNAGYVSGGLTTKSAVASAGSMTAIPNCLIFQYDQNSNGELVYFGYARGDDDVLYQFIPSVSPPAVNCIDASSSANWEPMNNLNMVRVTQFIPQVEAYADPVGSHQYVRKVNLVISVELSQFPEVKKNVTQVVYILNDTVSI